MAAKSKSFRNQRKYQRIHPHKKGSYTQENEPRIYIYKNGGIYVKPEEVLDSKNFRDQVNKMAKIRVTQGLAKPDP